MNNYHITVEEESVSLLYGQCNQLMSIRQVIMLGQIQDFWKGGSYV